MFGLLQNTKKDKENNNMLPFDIGVDDKEKYERNKNLGSLFAKGFMMKA